jgi:PKD repeat protein
MTGRGASTLLVLLSLSACFVVVVDASGNQANPFANDGGPHAVANCQVSPTSVTVGQQVNFDGSMSQGSPMGQTIAAWSWDFGDGSPRGIGSQVMHAYAVAGTYTAVLTVTDSATIQGSEHCSAVTVSP